MCIYFTRGGPVVIENNLGDRTTASYVAIEADGKQLVGEQAKRQASLNAKGTYYATKRYMGHKMTDDVVQNSQVQYVLKPAKNGDVRAAVTINGKEELWLLKNLLL